MSTQTTDTTVKTATASDTIWLRTEEAVRSCTHCGSPGCVSFEHERWARGNESTWLRQAVAA